MLAYKQVIRNIFLWIDLIGLKAKILTARGQNVYVQFYVEPLNSNLCQQRYFKFILVQWVAEMRGWVSQQCKLILQNQGWNVYIWKLPLFQFC